MQKNDICEFARVELLKERCLGVKQADQLSIIGLDYHTLQDFMRGYYSKSPLAKIINYLIEKGGVKLCPLKKEQSLNS